MAIALRHAHSKFDQKIESFRPLTQQDKTKENNRAIIMLHAASLRWVLLVLLLWMAGLGAAAQFAKFVVPFSQLGDAYPQAGNAIGWLVTVISGIGALMGMTSGVLVTRFGMGRTMIVGLALGGLVSLLQSALPNLPLMLLLRFIEGISHIMIVVAAPTLVAQFCNDRYRGAGMALWSSFFGVTFAAMAWFGLPLIESHGFAVLLQSHAAFMFAMALILAPLLKGLAPPVAAKAPLRLATILGDHLRTYRSPYLAAAAWGWLFYTMTFMSLFAVLPPLLPDENRALIVTIMPLLSIAVSLFGVPLMLIWCSAVTVTVIGFALGALTLAMFFTGASLATVAIASFAVLGLVQGASFAIVPQLNENAADQALANGAMAQLGNTGNLFGTPILLAIMTSLGQQAVLFAVICLYLSAIALHLILAKQRRG